MKNELSMYRIYGKDEYDYYDEYCEALTAKRAIERVKEWHDCGDGRHYEVLEIAKVLKLKCLK